jgi:TolB-like protein/DNA-binding winged helix-turn-helix (wHTH) protein/Flp pilus assembly protein TadD
LAAEAKSGPPIRFGNFELDVRSGELSKRGVRLPIQGRPVQALAILLENPGQIVTREEMRKRLWPADTFVDFEHGLHNAIARLREALSDSADTPRFIETLPRRGYRFIAPVTNTNVNSAAADKATTATAKPVRRFRPVLVAPGAIIIIVLVAAGVWFYRRSARIPQLVSIHSLAVLPLENLSGNPEEAYFADGMTDELITDLAKIGSLSVTSRTSSMRFKGSPIPLPQIARELKVDAVVEGSVTRSSNRVRITAQLVDAYHDRHLWAENYDGELGDVVALQNQIAEAIANEVQARLTPTERMQLAHVRPVNPAAYEAFLKGRYFYNKRTATGLQMAIKYFGEALAKDPSFAPAYAGLGECYNVFSFYNPAVPPTDSYEKARMAASKALQLDGALAEAHAALATVKFLSDRDWIGAEIEFKRSLELNPSYSPAHQWFGVYLYDLGRFEDALKEMRRAEEVDPLSLVINTQLGDVFYYSRRYDQAVEQELRTLSLDPNFGLAHESLGFDYIQESKYQEAIAEMQKASRLLGQDPAEYARLGYAYAMSGNRFKAQSILRRLINSSSRQHSRFLEIALLYIGLKDKNRALIWLGRAVEERSELVSSIKVDPIWDPLRDDPRFDDLLRRVGFPQ